MPRISLDELEELTNEDEFNPVELKRKLRKEKKEFKPKPEVVYSDE